VTPPKPHGMLPQATRLPVMVTQVPPCRWPARWAMARCNTGPERLITPCAAVDRLSNYSHVPLPSVPLSRKLARQVPFLPPFQPQKSSRAKLLCPFELSMAHHATSPTICSPVRVVRPLCFGRGHGNLCPGTRLRYDPTEGTGCLPESAAPF
jgi:hypothetical protein